MAEQKIVYDQMGEMVKVPVPPQRIVSLVPSQTELLYTLGLDKRVVGITKFCIHPQHWRTSKVVIGGTKRFSFDIIHSLNPDLIIGNKEENYADGIVQLKERYPVWMSDIFTMQDALEMMKSIGDITATEDAAALITTSIQNAFADLPQFRSRSCIYLIWKDPYMAAGTSTFIDDMLSRIGLVNVCRLARYPAITMEQVAQLDPELVLLSSEPYPFRNEHVKEIELVLPNADIRLVDGEMFSWYGSRMIEAANYFRALNL